MPKKKTNPIMTPEWFASLLETCVVPDGVLQAVDPPARADHTPLGPPAKPVVALDEFGSMTAEQEQALFDLWSRRDQSTAAAPPDDDWRHEPVLLALSILLQSMKQGNFEQARQETQTINRCLAMGQSPDPQLLEWMLQDVTGW